MTTTSIRSNIINKISQIDDKAFLQAINSIIENKAESGIYKLSKQQLDEINKSEKEIAKGKFVSNESLNKEVSQWLTEK
jgi:predicted transcriptional regulator